jgi:hypothetical protein
MMSIKILCEMKKMKKNQTIFGGCKFIRIFNQANVSENVKKSF